MSIPCTGFKESEFVHGLYSQSPDYDQMTREELVALAKQATDLQLQIEDLEEQVEELREDACNFESKAIALQDEVDFLREENKELSKTKDS